MKQVGFANGTWIQTADKILSEKATWKRKKNKKYCSSSSMNTRTMKSCFLWAWLTWAPRRSMCWLKSFLWVGCWDSYSLPNEHRHQIKAQHNMAAFSSVEVGHLSSTSACLLKPWGNLLFLRLLPSIKFGWSWIMHLKVVRHIHTGINTLHVSMKSTFLQDLQEGRC